MNTREQTMTSGGVDSYDNFIGDDSEYRDWLNFLGQHRDSETLEKSNFQSGLKALEEIDPDGNDHRVESFSHWGVGWIEEIYVRPDTPCADLAEDIGDALEGYPVVDEDALSELENEEASEYWDTWQKSEVLADCVRILENSDSSYWERPAKFKGFEIFRKGSLAPSRCAEFVDDNGLEVIDEWFHKCLDRQGQLYCHEGGTSYYWDPDRVSRDELAKLVTLTRQSS